MFAGDQGAEPLVQIVIGGLHWSASGGGGVALPMLQNVSTNLACRDVGMDPSVV